MRVRGGAVALALLLAVAGCSDDSSSSSTTTSTAPTPTLIGDGSAFCNAMLSVGQARSAQGASKQEVLAANEQLVAHLDEAQANTPEDAPPDLDSLIDDYRVASTAIVEAEGDVTKAFEALRADHPDAYARLGSETSHEEAYDFLVDRCDNKP